MASFIKKIVFTFVIVLFISCSNESKKTPQQQSPELSQSSKHLIVYGDSLAAGMMANTKLGQTLPNDEFLKLGKMLTDFVTTGEHDTDFFKKIDQKYSDDNVAAFAGTVEYSFSRRIEKELGISVSVKNYAISTARSNDILTEISDYMKSYSENGVNADFVVLHVGGNDWCDQKSVEDFKKSFEIVIRKLAEVHSQAKILIMPVPELVKVLRIRDTVAFQSNAELIQPQFKCSEVKPVLQTCLSRGIELGASDAAVAPHEGDLAAYNRSIEEVVQRVLKESGQSFSGKIEIARDYARGDGFSEKWLGIDCFHPGLYGQQQISIATWPALQKLL